ncbi:MAG: MmcQ/YjbR family DNA-binding protein [Chloroflexi bacterium]|nr:MAG: MmcQ/YjbR family DNA-binding protein [Chloroflexota bacterium]
MTGEARAPAPPASAAASTSEGGHAVDHDEVLDRLRAICLALPEATEKLTWGDVVTFRVRDKIFAMFEHDHHGRDENRTSVQLKAPPGGQETLAGADPQRFFRPPYVGHKGWVGIRLEGDVPWALVAGLVEESYQMTAPKRLTATLPNRNQ